MSEQVKEEGSFKIKKKPKQLVKDDIIKVDLSKKEEPKRRNRCHSSRRNKEGGCGRTNRK